MEKFLNKQFQGMVKREETKLAYKNLGKLRDDQQKLDQVVNQDFAYT